MIAHQIKHTLYKHCLFIICILLSIIFLPSVSAQENGLSQDTTAQSQPSSDNQEERLEGIVQNIIEEKKITPKGTHIPQLYQKLEIFINKGSLIGKKIIIENGNLPMSNIQKYQVGDTLVITYTKDIDGNNIFFITDYVRRGALASLFIIFILLVVAIGKKQGIAALIGMVISFVIVFTFILPQISSGKDPVWTAIIGSLAIIPATFLLSHGLNKKTFIAIGGTLISLIVTGILASMFVEAAKLTGFSSEEAGFLQTFKPNVINIKGLLLAGIIIGVLGVLDDITVSQSAIIQQLKDANPKISIGELYRRAMSVGKDHIASMVNTLILVYTGAALPLLLLFIDNPRPFTEIINYEIIADEVVRTLVGSIGLMLAVPITTFIAAFIVDKKR